MAGTSVPVVLNFENPLGIADALETDSCLNVTLES